MLELRRIWTRITANVDECRSRRETAYDYDRLPHPCRDFGSLENLPHDTVGNAPDERLPLPDKNDPAPHLMAHSRYRGMGEEPELAGDFYAVDYRVDIICPQPICRPLLAIVAVAIVNTRNTGSLAGGVVNRRFNYNR